MADFSYWKSYRTRNANVTEHLSYIYGHADASNVSENEAVFESEADDQSHKISHVFQPIIAGNYSSVNLQSAENASNSDPLDYAHYT